MVSEYALLRSQVHKTRLWRLHLRHRWHRILKEQGEGNIGVELVVPMEGHEDQVSDTEDEYSDITREVAIWKELGWKLSHFSAEEAKHITYLFGAYNVVAYL